MTKRTEQTRHTACVALAAVICLLYLAPGIALNAESADSVTYQPSLFIGDEAWYKDSSAPAFKDTDGFFIPAEAFCRISGVTLRTSDTLGCIALFYGERSFSADTSGGVIINPEGDTAIPLRRNGSVIYLPAENVAAALGLELETYVYPSGRTALRISDGSGQFTFSALAAMYLNTDDTGARQTGRIADCYSDRQYIFASGIYELNAAKEYCGSQITQYGFASFTLFVDAEFLLTAADTPDRSAEVFSLLGDICADGTRVCVYSDEPDFGLLVHYMLMARQTLSFYLHTFSPFCSSRRSLTEDELATINNAGLIFVRPHSAADYTEGET